MVWLHFYKSTSVNVSICSSSYKNTHSYVYNNVYSKVDIYGWWVLFLLCSFYFIFLNYLWAAYFHKTKKFKKERSEENTLSCYHIIIDVQRDYGYFSPLYFSAVSKLAHLSDLSLAITISSWLFTDLCALIGPITTPSHGSVFYLHCNIHHILMLLIKLSLFLTRH